MRFNSFIKWIALTILCGAVAFMGVREYFWLSKEAIDLNDPEVDWSELKAGDHVEMDITYLFDPFVITTSKKGVETMRTYAMPRIESIDSNGYWSITDYIGVHVNNTDLFASYDKLCDETIDWWTDDDAIEYNPTTIHIDGVVREMDSESKDYFRQYLSEMEYDDDFINSTACSLAVYPAQNANWYIVAIGLVGMLAGIGIIVYKVVKKK